MAKKYERALLVYGMACAVQVVEPGTLETMPLGTVLLCTPDQLRNAATLLEQGAHRDEIIEAIGPFRTAP